MSHTLIFPLSRSRTASDQVDAVMQETVPSVPRYIRTSAIALLVAVSYYAGSQIGFLFTPAQSAISTFWPPNAILLAAFLLTPPRIWWVLLLAVMPAHLSIQLRTGIPLLSSLGWFVGNTGEALLGETTPEARLSSQARRPPPRARIMDFSADRLCMRPPYVATCVSITRER